MILVQTYLEIPTRPSQKLQLWIPGFWIDALILLKNCYTEESLVLFLKLAWLLPLRPLATTLFLEKWVSYLKSIDVCSIYPFCATLMENIAMRVGLLISHSWQKMRILLYYYLVSKAGARRTARFSFQKVQKQFKLQNPWTAQYAFKKFTWLLTAYFYHKNFKKIVKVFLRETRIFYYGIWGCDRIHFKQ